MTPLVSIVIPTYQRPALLARCLDALRRQRFAKNRFEIIVVTDGPDEATHNLIRQQPNTAPYMWAYSLPEKKGPAAARNLGWQKAKARLILFTDDDCIPGHLWIHTYFNAWYADPQRLMAFTGQVLVPQPPRPTDYEKNVARLEMAEFLTANCACTKAALQQVNGFDEAFTMAWREDSDLEFKLLMQDIPIRFIQQAIVTHPVRTAPWGISLKEQKKSMFNALLYKKYPQLYRERISNRPLWNYYTMILCFLCAVIAFVQNWHLIAIAASVAWLMLVIAFINKRLSGTTHSLRHIVEMVVTSLLIPFLSVYWTLYGSFKFKTHLL